jgi:hypothetical protein
VLWFGSCVLIAMLCWRLEGRVWCSLCLSCCIVNEVEHPSTRTCRDTLPPLHCRQLIGTAVMNDHHHHQITKLSQQL